MGFSGTDGETGAGSPGPVLPETGGKGRAKALPGRHPNPLMRGVLVAAGTVSAGLGIVGIFLPVLPTTPFLLLAAACYVRSSARLYAWLLSSRWTGRYIRDFREGRGMPLSAKVFSIALLWATLGFSAWLVDHPGVHLLLGLVALGVPLIILSVPTSQDR